MDAFRRLLPAPPVRAGLERILFVHIPKTAGMSLYHALERWAGPGRAIRFPNGGPDDLAAWLALPTGRLEELRVISGHLPLHDFERRRLDGWQPVTLLRDPVARWLSTYTYVRGQRSHPWHRLVSGMDLEAFVDWFAARPANTDQQCGFVSPERTARAAFEVLSERFLLAGSVERLDVFEDRLGAALGTAIRIPRRNRSRRPLDRSSVPAATLARIQELQAEDELLYRRVLEAGLVGSASSSTR
jgi:hypothetical protein